MARTQASVQSPFVGMLKRLRFTNDAAKAIVNQGYDSLDELKLMTDPDVSNLCKIIRKPGGTGNGDQVSLVAENYLKLACYYIRHREDRVQRSVTVSGLTLDQIKDLRELRTQELSYVKPVADEYPTMRDSNWPENFDNLQSFLSSYLGEGGIPLMSVCRTDQNVKPEADDPESNYESVQEEMIARSAFVVSSSTGARVHPHYRANREKVYDILVKLTESKPSRVIIRPFQRARDGRAAYTALYHHYLGTNAINDTVTTVEAQLNNYKYKGETKKHTFVKFVTFQKKCHNSLAALEPHGYKGLDERSKVRILMGCIETPTVDTVKTKILSDTQLQQNYDAATQLYQSFISQMKSTKPPEQFHVSSVNSATVSDRYYSKSEYSKLDKTAKRKLYELRQARGGGGGEGSSKRQKLSGVSKKAFDKLHRKVAALEIQNNDSETETEGSDTPAPATNRKNSALKQPIRKNAN